MLENNLILDDEREEVSEETLLDHNFRNRGREQKEEYEKHKKALKNARNIMLLIIGLGILADFVLLFSSEEASTFEWVFISVYFSIMIGLYFLSFKYPLAAFIGFLIFFVAIWLLSILGDPSQAYRGIILRVIAVILLIKGATSAGRVQGLRKELVSRYLREKELIEKEEGMA